jgi:hypothetical protein
MLTMQLPGAGILMQQQQHHIVLSHLHPEADQCNERQLQIPVSIAAPNLHCTTAM